MVQFVKNIGSMIVISTILFLLIGSGKPRYKTPVEVTQEQQKRDTLQVVNQQNIPDQQKTQSLQPLPEITEQNLTESQIEIDTIAEDSIDVDTIPIPLDLLSRAESLSQRLDEWISKPLVSKATWGIRVVRLKDGKVLYDRNGKLTLKPASNVKLFTVAAAYELLGENYRYQTLFIASTPLDENGILNGNLMVVGTGDPTQSTIYHGEEAKQLFYKIADSLVAKGLRRINGQIVIQKQTWAESGPPPGWMWEDVVESYGSAPELLMYDDNCYEIAISPSTRLGDYATISMIDEDESYLSDFVVEAVTVPSQVDQGLSVLPSLQTGERRIVGTVAYAARQKRKRVVRRDPYTYWKTSLENALKARGVIITTGSSNPPKRTRTRSTNPNPKPSSSVQGYDTLFVLYSLPLKKISDSIMKLSHNPSSEAVLRTIGYVKNSKWSTAAGNEVEMKLFQSWGLDLDYFDLKDGSGISHANYVSASVVTDLLQKVTTKQWFPEYYANLPYIGEPKSTLSGRRLILPDSVEIRAKTGTIRNVLTLSGYITSPNDTLIFSILCNNYPKRSKRQSGKNLVKLSQNGILTELAWFLAPQGPRRNLSTPEPFPNIK
ncbi:MAG: D-alanyl-D-alanine carboxypeptidase/D-alanyl-D-alanine-endopeptidase [bacterium]|nr:D-alanyl-D-alanine carboxypeptidase/D-alanyl-D-alanine-endopeptidase [bacterium]